MSDQPEALRLAYISQYLEGGERGKWNIDVVAELRRQHELLDKFKWQVRDTCTRAEKAEAERDALKETLHDELAENMRLRELGGAREDEPFTTFMERVIAERDALLKALVDIMPLADFGAAEQSPPYASEHLLDAAQAAIDAAREAK